VTGHELPKLDHDETGSLRRVGSAPDETTVRLTFYFDGPIADADREAVPRVETEVMADMSDPSSASTRCTRVDRPTTIIDAGVCNELRCRARRVRP
jgi:hypothetical protein